MRCDDRARCSERARTRDACECRAAPPRCRAWCAFSAPPGMSVGVPRAAHDSMTDGALAGWRATTAERSIASGAGANTSIERSELTFTTSALDWLRCYIVERDRIGEARGDRWPDDLVSRGAFELAAAVCALNAHRVALGRRIWPGASREAGALTGATAGCDIATPTTPLGAGATRRVTGVAEPQEQEGLPPRNRWTQDGRTAQRTPETHRQGNATVINTSQTRLKPLPTNADQQIPTPGGPTCMCVCSHTLPESTHTCRARPLAMERARWNDDNCGQPARSN